TTFRAVTEPPGAGLRALVVDDEPPIRALMRTVLELDGWEVLEAEDVAQALALAKAERPHGVVLDVMMPVKDGFDVLAELRRTEHGRAMAVVMLTATRRPPDIVNGVGGCVALCITKPFARHYILGQLPYHVHGLGPGARAKRPATLRPVRRRPAAPPSCYSSSIE